MTQPEVPDVVMCSFYLDTRTKVGQVFANVPLPLALNVLQGLTIDLMVKQQSENGGSDEASRVGEQPQSGPGGQ